MLPIVLLCVNQWDHGRGRNILGRRAQDRNSRESQQWRTARGKKGANRLTGPCLIRGMRSAGCEAFSKFLPTVAELMVHVVCRCIKLSVVVSCHRRLSPRCLDTRVLLTKSSGLCSSSVRPKATRASQLVEERIPHGHSASAGIPAIPRWSITANDPQVAWYAALLTLLTSFPAPCRLYPWPSSAYCDPSSSNSAFQPCTPPHTAQRRHPSRLVERLLKVLLCLCSSCGLLIAFSRRLRGQ